MSTPQTNPANPGDKPKKARKADPAALAFKAYKLAAKVVSLQGKLKTAVDGLTPEARAVFDKLSK